jgi:2-phospho-L-lactate guanylyltransferase
MTVLVPFAVERPKTRLSSILDADERAAFARVMLADVLDAIEAAGHEPTVLATSQPSVDRDVAVAVDGRSLTTAVNDRLGEADGRVAVVMADLPLVTPTAIDRLFATAEDADVAIAPGRGGGTNALVTGDAGFRVDYHGLSYRDHCVAARDIGATTAAVDSFRLATDIDEPADLVEVVLHGEGEAAAWLREAGVRAATTEGRATVVRE